MKNENLKLLPTFVVGLIVMTASAWMFAPLTGGEYWLLWILGAVLLCVGAVVCHALSNRRAAVYVLGYLINAVSSGCAAATLYGQMGWDVELLMLLCGVAPVALLGAVFCLGYFGQGKLWRKIWGLAMALLALALMVAAVILWIKWNPVAGSMGFFSGICLLFFIMACLATLDSPKEKWRYLSFSGFWAFAVILIVVLVILSEGEILDGLDFDFSGGSAKKKRGK